MGHIHYRVRGARHGRSYRTSAAARRPAPLPQERQAEPRTRATRPRREGLGVVSQQTTSAWRALLAPDGTPPAQPLQIAYVRRAVWQQTGQTPSLRRLTIGQAERILRAVGADPRPLWRAGRSAPPVNLAAFGARWLVLVLVCLAFLDIGRVAGVPFVLVVVGSSWLAFLRRQRRQGFEDRHYRPAARPDASPPRPAPPADPSQPPPGSPYNVDTYLRRLSEDGP